jgi:hypothetical protein
MSLRLKSRTRPPSAGDWPTASRRPRPTTASTGEPIGCATAPASPAPRGCRATRARRLEARETFDKELFNLQRLYLPNRGIWEAIDSAGRGGLLVADDAHVEAYLEAFGGSPD